MIFTTYLQSIGVPLQKNLKLEHMVNKPTSGLIDCGRFQIDSYDKLTFKDMDAIYTKII
jgi:hypothetical protein